MCRGKGMIRHPDSCVASRRTSARLHVIKRVLDVFLIEGGCGVPPSLMHVAKNHVQHVFLRHLEMCQQPAKEWLFLPLFLILLGRFHVQDSRDLFRARYNENVKDHAARQIAQCNLFATRKLKYVPLWVFQHSENRLGFWAEGQQCLLTF
jgi:hypothetical protein